IVVADGMGGHVAGEIASELATERVAEIPPGEEAITPRDRVNSANERLLLAVRENPALLGMGTTMTLGVFDDGGMLHIGHVGDSRAYLLRDGEMRQLTRDHTVVAELVALGHLSPEAAEHHPQRHLLTRTLGLGPVEVDEYEYRLQPGDRVLICSDGLTSMVDDDDIRAMAGGDVEATVWALIEAANAAGGVDNTTVAIVDVSE
ncbi:MAG: serine/threonine-protein phosphatase, partial [Actinobacteria bacterium]